MNNTAPRKPRFKKFAAGNRKSVSLSKKDLIETTSLEPGQTLPLVIQPKMDSVNLFDWTKNNLEFIESHLLKHGGILFRGFGMKSQADFEQFLTALSLDLLDYMESATPRTELSKKVYTSTEFPPDQTIALHNELSYVTTWPMKILFFCLKPAEQGGETPIADVRKVYKRIEKKSLKRFAEKGWMLVRNFGDGFGLPWQTSFHTTDKASTETYFRNALIEFEWKDKNHLRTRQVRPAVAKHPNTGEAVWFNHIAFWHVSSLCPEIRETFLAKFKTEDFPYNTYYGDGSPIEDSVVAFLRKAYRGETVVFPWQAGDILLLDNMLVAHGRNPFTGTRRVLAAMGEKSSQNK